MLPGGGFSPYGVDMFPGHGGTGLPSPAAYANPAAAQFGVASYGVSNYDQNAAEIYLHNRNIVMQACYI